jgi:hypothetical protein
MWVKKILKAAFWKRVSLGLASLAIGAAFWLPTVHLFFSEPVDTYFSQEGIPPGAGKLAERHLALWRNPASKEFEVNRMRASNAEWDFMGRTFLVWSLAEMALRDPTSRDEYLSIMDRIIDDTLAVEEREGMYFFLMPYAKEGLYIQKPPRCQFLDGEIALMIAMRRVVEEKDEYKPLLIDRVDKIVERMHKSAVLSAESYPDECWTFDNIIALTAVRLSDYLDGTDHSEFIERWIAMAKEDLVEPRTGLLISAFTTWGETLHGPEGSTIWMVAHCLKLLDEDFARDQYRRAKKELALDVCGFTVGREWPGSWEGGFADIDSGPIVPVIGASAGSSGMAFIGAHSFGDDDLLERLLRSLNFAAFPVETEESIRFCASNQVGDAALLYSMVLGPVWERVKEGKNHE